MSKIGTKRVDLEDGDYAVIYLELRHGTARRVQEVTRRFIRQGDGDKKKKPTVDWKNAEWAEADDQLILGQVTEWSFGEVTLEILDDMSERKRELLLRAIDAEIKARPLPESGGGS